LEENKLVWKEINVPKVIREACAKFVKIITLK
jgi:hypothetical protein